jgi:hypothetical protein
MIARIGWNSFNTPGIVVTSVETRAITGYVNLMQRMKEAEMRGGEQHVLTLATAQVARGLSVIGALTEAIESLLSDIDNGRFDPGLLIERHRSLYTSEKMAERTEAVYWQVLESKSAGGGCGQTGGCGR